MGVWGLTTVQCQASSRLPCQVVSVQFWPWSLLSVTGASQLLGNPGAVNGTFCPVLLSSSSSSSPGLGKCCTAKGVWHGYTPLLAPRLPKMVFTARWAPLSVMNSRPLQPPEEKLPWKSGCLSLGSPAPGEDLGKGEERVQALSLALAYLKSVQPTRSHRDGSKQAHWEALFLRDFFPGWTLPGCP